MRLLSRHCLRPVLAMLAAGFLSGTVMAQSSGAPARGAQLYQSRCGACHSVNAHRVGPKHAGVFNRRAGTQSGFRYTPALAESGLIWDRDTLDLWLEDPTGLVPGTSMGFRVRDAQDRADIIAFLETLLAE